MRIYEAEAGQPALKRDPQRQRRAQGHQARDRWPGLGFRPTLACSHVRVTVQERDANDTNSGPRPGGLEGDQLHSAPRRPDPRPKDPTPPFSGPPVGTWGQCGPNTRRPPAPPIRPGCGRRPGPRSRPRRSLARARTARAAHLAVASPGPRPPRPPGARAPRELLQVELQRQLFQPSGPCPPKPRPRRCACAVLRDRPRFPDSLLGGTSGTLSSDRKSRGGA